MLSNVRMYSTCSVVSDSLWARGLQSARLLCPCNFPGKNTEVGCHFRLQGIFPIHEPTSPASVSCIAGRFFTAEPWRKLQECIDMPQNSVLLGTHLGSPFWCSNVPHGKHWVHVSYSEVGPMSEFRNPYMQRSLAFFNSLLGASAAGNLLLSSAQ